MKAELPGVSVSLNHFRFTREVLVSIVVHVTFTYERLKIRSKLYSIGRVHVDHLDLPAHSLVLQQ